MGQLRHWSTTRLSHPLRRLIAMAETMQISCEDCVMEGTDTCADCVVTFLCEREPGDALIIDVAEARALRLLEQGGLAPALRHRRRA